MEVTFSELLTTALMNKTPQYITRLPKCLLNPVETKQVDYLIKCLNDSWIPSIDTFKREFRFIERPTEIPADVLYKNFSEQRRDEYIAEKVVEFVEKNKEENRNPYTGLAAFQAGLLEKTVIPNPKVIDYGSLSREQYKTNVYRSEYYVPHFNEISQGLLGGDFIVFMAGTKGYKTTLLKTMVLGAYRQGKENVVICSQEQAPLALAQQMDMQSLYKSHSTLRSGITDDQFNELKVLESKVRRYENKMFITPPVRSVRELHEYIVSLNVRVHKIFIDGLNLMQGDSTDSYGSLQRVCSELKAYAIEHDMIIVCVTQSNREGYKSSINMGAQHIAGSFAIAMFADIMIAMSTIVEKGRDNVYIRPLLNRHGTLDRKILMIPNIKDPVTNKIYHEFRELPPDYSPEEAVIASEGKTPMRANYENENGPAWETVKSQIGEREAEGLISFLSEGDSLTELNSAVHELAQEPF